MRSLYYKLNKLTSNINNDHIGEYSAQCAYYVILSFIPFILLLLTLTQYININPEELIEIVKKIVPQNISGYVVNIMQEVYSKSIGTISISLIFTLISADKGLFSFTKGLHFIYKSEEVKDKPYIYLKLTSIIKTAIFIVLIAIGMVILVFSNPIIQTIKSKFGGFANYNLFSEMISKLFFILIVFVIFLFIYKFTPTHKNNKLKNQIKGAIFASISLNVISFIFSKYLDIFKGFSITYGSFTTLMLIMMWTYACFYAIFLGAEINKLNIK